MTRRIYPDICSAGFRLMDHGGIGDLACTAGIDPSTEPHLRSDRARDP